MDKRTKKRFDRENNKDRKNLKKVSWYCAGCKDRHPNGNRCPIPRLFANSVHGSVAS